MKAWFIALPLLCMTALVHAEVMPPTPAVPETAAPPAKVQPLPKKQKMQKTRAKQLPRGDIRHCLDLQTNEEIIKCAETRGK